MVKLGEHEDAALLVAQPAQRLLQPRRELPLLGQLVRTRPRVGHREPLVHRLDRQLLAPVLADQKPVHHRVDPRRQLRRALGAVAGERRLAPLPRVLLAGRI